MLGNNSQINQIGVLYSHGDVLIKRIDRIPLGAQRREGSILAHGEVTRHSHRIQQAEAVKLWSQNNELFLEVKSTIATLIHEEHRAIELTQGVLQSYRAADRFP
jgi:hypothetical protein